MKSLKFIFLVLLSIKIICIIQDESLNILLGNDNFDVFKYSLKLKNDTLIIYKIVDFALNNYIGTKYITGGAIIVQYSLNHLIDYIFDWMTTNSITNFKILPPKTTADENEIQYKSTAHAVYLNLNVLNEQNASDYKF